MKIIRISTDNELTVHEFPEGDYMQQNQALRELIGNNCDIYERVMPQKLYTDFHMRMRPTKTDGQCVCMLADEEGGLKENVPNLIGSYLYGTDAHGNPIMGNVLFVGEKWDREGIDFCGIEDSVFEFLKLQLTGLISKIKELKEDDFK